MISSSGGFVHHQQHVGTQQQVMDLTSSSQQQRFHYQLQQFELQAKQIAATLAVPTLPTDVRADLRSLGLPVRLFGENLANVRERLRLELARRLVLQQNDSITVKQETQEHNDYNEAEREEDEEVMKYTRASAALIEARHEICQFSLKQAQERLTRERRLRDLAVAAAQQRKRKSFVETEDNDQKMSFVVKTELSLLDEKCSRLYRRLRHSICLEGSQYGDARVVSCVSSCRGLDFNAINLIATGSWTGNLSLWDASTPALSCLGRQTQCHQDRIMGMDMIPLRNTQDAGLGLIATASIDRTAKLWTVSLNSLYDSDKEMENLDAFTKDAHAVTELPQDKFIIKETAHLQGHAARLCRVAFHPLHKHVATTSYDHSWRLWDIETGQNILLQDGHWKECYGIGFHPDGSLCSTTDFAGVVQVWDLRTGKSITSHCAHAKRVLNTVFAPINGFHLATAGDDGTIKIFDLRRCKLAVAAIPAHSHLITQIKYDSTGEVLASSSFDGTAKLWACRNWKMLKQLQGHDGKVTGITILDDGQSFVTTGFDKTLKLWR